jgi:hypothetical protein
MKTRNAEGSSALFSEMIPDLSDEAEFNDWYDNEHIPLRMGVPGFLSAQRYLIPETHHYFVVYEIMSAAVLKTTPYQQLKNNPGERSMRMLRSVTGFTRYIGDEIGRQARESSAKAEPIDAPYLCVDFFSVPLERQPEFNNWYERDYTPAIRERKAWMMARRFRIIEGEPENYTHLSLHYLADTRDLAAPEPGWARASYWPGCLAQENWFKAKHLVFSRHGARQGSAG